MHCTSAGIIMIYKKKLPSAEFLCISDHLVAGRPVDMDDEAHLVNNYIIIIIIIIIMKPTPQASFSCAGSYKPSAWWVDSINFSIIRFNSITISPAPGCPNPLDGRSWLSQFFFRRYFLVLTSGSLQLVSSKGIISCSHQMSQKEQIVLKYC